MARDSEGFIEKTNIKKDSSIVKKLKELRHFIDLQLSVYIPDADTPKRHNEIINEIREDISAIIEVEELEWV